MPILSVLLALPLMVALPVDSASTPPTPQGGVPVVKGVALLDWGHKTDMSLLAADHFYGWGPYCGSADNCVNMNRNWTLPQTSCYDTMLLGNEPTNPEPAGHPIEPSVAASVTVAIEQACPSTALVVGNVHLNNGNGEGDKAWIVLYLAEYEKLAGHALRAPHRLGVHCYSGGGGRCLDRIRAITAIFPGKLWVTEFGIYSPEQLTKFLKGIALLTQVERIYAWTNRNPGDLLEMVNSDGTLTPLGQVYAAWEPPTVTQVWLPQINRPD